MCCKHSRSSEIHLLCFLSLAQTYSCRVVQPCSWALPRACASRASCWTRSRIACYLVPRTTSSCWSWTTSTATPGRWVAGAPLRSGLYALRRGSCIVNEIRYFICQFYRYVGIREHGSLCGIIKYRTVDTDMDRHKKYEYVWHMCIYLHGQTYTAYSQALRPVHGYLTEWLIGLG